MKKLLIYITQSDINWLKGFEYFIGEWQLDYEVLQYHTVEKLLQHSQELYGDIQAIILDWELPENGLIKQEAFEKLEKNFPFIPVIALSEYDFQGYYPESTNINKKTDNPEELFNTIVTFINFYKNDWINNKINRIIYSVEIISAIKNPAANIKEKQFYNSNPLVSRQEAIDYFKKNKAFQITVYGFRTDLDVEDSLPDISKGGIIIYSDVLSDREILANLNAEYKLYSLNDFSTEGFVQVIHLPGFSKPLIILINIVNEKGEILLR